jgi:hypothetical protein
MQNQFSSDGQKLYPIPEYPGYFVTLTGEIWSALRINGKGRGLVEPRKLRQYHRYYSTVHLCRNSRVKIFRVHSLMALVFLGKRPEGMEVCHNDGNARNNAISNLRYDTPKNNSADSQRHGTHHSGERSVHAKLKDSDIPKIIARNAAGESQRSLSKAFGICQPTISAIITGKRWRHVPRS